VNLRALRKIAATGIAQWNRAPTRHVVGPAFHNDQERAMGFGRGILLWLLGVPLPIIILLALFWHH